MNYELLFNPIPWYIAGPLIGLTVPLLLFIGNKTFGISSSFQHMCAAVMPKRFSYFNYDWWKQGRWHLQLALGILIGGAIAYAFIPEGYSVNISESTKSWLYGIGVTEFKGLVPSEIFSWGNLWTFPGFLILVVGGFMIGFGTRYAGGCTSGHAITGLATFQKASLIAVVSFFIGGLLTTHFILPKLLG
ncbi:MAG: YeeE/YedE family protein [Balneolales bacterium]|nr:YeeE/YedE family protein [Balneolales bacterium]